MKIKLEGNKTYIVAALVLIAAIAGKSTGILDTATTAELISIALLSAGIRHGIG